MPPIKGYCDDYRKLEKINGVIYDMSLSLRGFPGITMTLEEIFERVEE